MTPTVDDLRDEIRRAVGRHERVESTQFTKEALAAVCEAVGHEVGEGRLPPKSEMRAAILRASGVDEDAEPGECTTAFRKAQLEAIAEVLRDA